MINPKAKQVETDTRFGEQMLFRGSDILGHNKPADFFYNFWQDLNKDGKLPSRKDIHPRHLIKYLENVVLMDCEFNSHGKLILHMKLMGTHVTAHYGELTGKTLDDMTNKDAVRRINHTSQLVITEKQPILGITPGYTNEKLFMEAAAIYLPLFNDKGDVNKIMVSVDVTAMKK